MPPRKRNTNTKDKSLSSLPPPSKPILLFSETSPRGVVNEITSTNGAFNISRKTSPTLNKRRWTYHNIILFLKEAFLPAGYPDSVTDDYTRYQIFDTLQAFCSSITGLLAVRSTFKRLGVGDVTATTSGALITWVIQDGTGMIARILFAWKLSSRLDADVKRWRFSADIFNDLGFLLELALVPTFPKEFIVPAACLATIMKSLCGVAGGSTKAALSQHFAKMNNTADLSAKDGSQETIVSLVGMILGTYLVTHVPETPLWTWLTFLVFTALHLLSNYLAVTGIVLETLNEQRFGLVFDYWYEKKDAPSLQYVGKNEQIFWRERSSRNGWKISVGASIRSLPNASRGELVEKLVRVTGSSEKYLIYPDCRRKIVWIILHTTAETRDILQAYFHGLCLLKLKLERKTTEEECLDAVGKTLEIVLEQFEKFINACRKMEWKVDDDRCYFACKEWRANWESMEKRRKSKKQ